MPAKPDQQYTDKETERRATAALRRALTTPYKPQSEMKIGRRSKKPTKKKLPKSK